MPQSESHLTDDEIEDAFVKFVERIGKPKRGLDYAHASSATRKYFRSLGIAAPRLKEVLGCGSIHGEVRGLLIDIHGPLDDKP